jgi:hypothetical protein
MRDDKRERKRVRERNSMSKRLRERRDEERSDAAKTFLDDHMRERENGNGSNIGVPGRSDRSDREGTFSQRKRKRRKKCEGSFTIICYVPRSMYKWRSRRRSRRRRRRRGRRRKRRRREYV